MKGGPRVISYAPNLADWGLSITGLRQLGDRPVHLCAYFRQHRESALFGLSPAARRDAIWRAQSRKYRVLAAWWPNSEYGPIGSLKEPEGFRGMLPARLVPRLRSLPVLYVWIDRIEGKRALRPKQPRPEFFAVQARFAVQVEGMTKGRQLYEDRIVLVRARSKEEAVGRLRKPFDAYGRPHLNRNGFMVRWAFEKILEVYDTCEDHVDPAGTEVFSQLKWRRLRPQFVWRKARST